MADDENELPRLTMGIRQQLMKLNDGFTAKTHYDSPNFTESRTYRISDGELHVRASGNTSWADSRYVNEFVADDRATQDFLRKHKEEFNWDGVDRTLRIPKPAPAAERPSATDLHTDDVENDDTTFRNAMIALGVLAVVTVAVVVYVNREPIARKVKQTTAAVRKKALRTTERRASRAQKAVRAPRGDADGPAPG